MSVFSVVGPLEIKPIRLPRGFIINKDLFTSFWNKHQKYKDKRGIYIFGLRAAKGYTPWYVGKTKRTFENECAESHKLQYYNQVIAQRKGTPVFFFLFQDTGKRGPNNDSILDHVEKYFIEIALIKNPDLMNRKKTKKPDWSVDGVINSTKGKATKQSRAFKAFIGLQ